MDFENGIPRYVVVEFPDEKVDERTPHSIISSTWILNNAQGDQSCYWPGYFKNDADRTKAVIGHKPLKLSDCGESKINVLYLSSVYSKATAKMKELETVSGVSQTESDSDDGKKKKRKRPKKIIDDDFEFEVASGDELVAVPPKLTINKESVKKQSQRTVGGEDQTQSPASISGSSPIITPVLKIRNQNSTSSNKDQIFAREDKTHSPTSSFSGYSSTSVSSTKRLFCNKDDGLRDVLSYLHQINNKISTVEEKITFLINAQGDKSNAADRIVPIEFKQCESKEDLEDLNTNLSDIKVMGSLVNTLQVIGGKDVPDTVYRMLSKMIKHELSLKYNWSGKNNKEKFGDYLNIVKLITVTVRRNPFGSGTTTKQVEDVIKLWLRNAGDRDGGRTKRKCK